MRQIILEFILGVFAIKVLWIILVYNHLVTLRIRCENAASQTDILLKMRFGLVPLLVSSVRGYSSYEKGILEEIASLRPKFLDAKSLDEKEDIDMSLSRALKRISILVESYPRLKASKSFMILQLQLTKLENHIMHARQFYNEDVILFNKVITKFPTNMVAKAFGFSQFPYFGG